MSGELEKGLGFIAVYALIITSMIGSSLFFGISEGAHLAGSWSLIAWVLLGIVTVYVAACFGELIAMFPSSGGVYEFTKQAYGRFPSFLVGWASWIVSNVGSAVLVVAALEFILPGSSTVQIFGLEVGRGTIKVIAAIVLILLFNFITYRGIEASGIILIIFAAIVLILLVATIIPGFTIFDASNLVLTGGPPISMLLVTIFFLVESFFGWESASFLAEETKDPARTIPKALVWASASIAVLGVLLAFVLIGAYPSSQLGADPNPVLHLIKDVFPQAAPVFLLGVFLAFIAGVISNVVSCPRLLFALARDRLFIEQATKLHPVHKTPVNAILFQTIVTLALVLFAFGRYQFLVSVLVPIALAMYAVVLFSVPALRKSKPNHPRSFKVIAGTWLPNVIAVFYICVVIGYFVITPGSSSVLLLIAGFFLLAIPVYWFVTMAYNPDAIITVSDTAAKLTYWLEDFLLPKRIRHELVDIFRLHIRGKTVLEFGAGVGTLTEELAEAVGPKGTVIAIDLSRSNLAIIERRLATTRFSQRGAGMVRTVHDEHQVNRVHPTITHADVVYSVGFLGYMQDLRKVLRELNGILPPGGRVCFVEYVDFFKVLPDPVVVSDIARLEQAFIDSGFAISVRRRKGMLWNYLIIEGLKTDSKQAYI